ncbi:hypothetical protein NMG60_11017212 [Bertholletia excelsa]
MGKTASSKAAQIAVMAILVSVMLLMSSHPVAAAAFPDAATHLGRRLLGRGAYDSYDPNGRGAYNSYDLDGRGAYNSYDPNGRGGYNSANP